MLFCLAHLSNKFVLQNFTCQHYLSPRAAPFQRHSSGTVHHSKDGGFVLTRTGDKITVRDILESRTEFGQNYLVLTWKDTRRNMYPYFWDFV